MREVFEGAAYKLHQAFPELFLGSRAIDAILLEMEPDRRSYVVDFLRNPSGKKISTLDFQEYFFFRSEIDVKTKIALDVILMEKSLRDGSAVGLHLDIIMQHYSACDPVFQLNNIIDDDYFKALSFEKLFAIMTWLGATFFMRTEDSRFLYPSWSQETGFAALRTLAIVMAYKSRSLSS